MSKDILIDDLRDPKDFGDPVVARTYTAGVRLLRDGGWDTVYLDNDLGEGQKEGWEILSWMMRSISEDLWPDTFVIVSSNVAARLTMASKLRAMGYEHIGDTSKGYSVWRRPQSQHKSKDTRSEMPRLINATSEKQALRPTVRDNLTLEREGGQLVEPSTSKEAFLTGQERMILQREAPGLLQSAEEIQRNNGDLLLRSLKEHNGHQLGQRLYDIAEALAYGRGTAKDLAEQWKNLRQTARSNPPPTGQQSMVLKQPSKKPQTTLIDTGQGFFLEPMAPAWRGRCASLPTIDNVLKKFASSTKLPDIKTNLTHGYNSYGTHWRPLSEIKELEVDERGNEWFDDSALDLNKTMAVWVDNDPRDAVLYRLSSNFANVVNNYGENVPRDPPPEYKLGKNLYESEKESFVNALNNVSKVSLAGAIPVIQHDEIFGKGYLYIKPVLKTDDGRLRQRAKRSSIIGVVDNFLSATRFASEENLSESFWNWFRGSKVVDDQGKPLRVFHGTSRPDRVGTRFMKTRATSGPMPYFTDDPAVASGTYNPASKNIRHVSASEGDKLISSFAAAWELEKLIWNDYHSNPEELKRVLVSIGTQEALEATSKIDKNRHSLKDCLSVNLEKEVVKLNKKYGKMYNKIVEEEDGFWEPAGVGLFKLALLVGDLPTRDYFFKDDYFRPECSLVFSPRTNKTYTVCRYHDGTIEEIYESFPNEKETLEYKQASTSSWETYSDKYGEELEEAINNIMSNRKPRTLPPLDTSRMRKIWQDYARLGIVRDERGVDNIVDDFLQKVVRIDVNNYLSGHTPHDPLDEFTERGLTIPEDIDDRIDRQISDMHGNWMISDYGIERLAKLINQAMSETDYEKKLLALDAMLNVVHQRSDLASWFVRGGRASLEAISENVQKDNTTHNHKKANEATSMVRLAAGRIKTALPVSDSDKGVVDLFFQTLSAEDIQKVLDDLEEGKKVTLPSYQGWDERTIDKSMLDLDDYKRIVDMHRKYPKHGSKNPIFKYENGKYVKTKNRSVPMVETVIDKSDHAMEVLSGIEDTIRYTVPNTTRSVNIVVYKNPTSHEIDEIIKEDPDIRDQLSVLSGPFLPTQPSVRAAIDDNGDLYAWSGHVMHGSVKFLLSTPKTWVMTLEYAPNLKKVIIQDIKGDDLNKALGQNIDRIKKSFPYANTISYRGEKEFFIREDKGRYVLESVLHSTQKDDSSNVPMSLVRQFHRYASSINVVSKYLRRLAKENYYRVVAKNVRIIPENVPDDVWERFSMVMRRRGYDWRGGADAKEMLSKWRREMGEVELPEEHSEAFLEAIEKKDALKPKSSPSVRKSILQRAIKTFGTTENPESAGYIMPDGELLNLGYGFGGRQQDHREIASVLPKDIRENAKSGTDIIKAFCSLGPVRMHVGTSVSFDVHVRPSSDQISRIRDVLYSMPSKEVTVQVGGIHEDFPAGDPDAVVEFIMRHTGY